MAKNIPISEETKEISDYTYGIMMKRMNKVLEDIHVPKHSPIPIRAVKLHSASAALICSGKKRKYTTMPWHTRYRGKLVLIGSDKENPRYRNKAFAIVTIWTIKKRGEEYDWFVVKVQQKRAFTPTEKIRDNDFCIIKIPSDWGGL